MLSYRLFILYFLYCTNFRISSEYIFIHKYRVCGHSW
nr:MAG TPA: hypothetical protein [Caudoviricetes sp.]